ncbi:MAG: Rieske 2Fe-2S domain-containing protein [Candidatus Dormiibacterota bacterium]
MTEISLPIDYSALVQKDRVNRRVYTDPIIFDEEMERIWRRGWVFVAHQSELPEPGDYVTRTVGVEPIIVTRGLDGEVRGLMNRCTHRANLLCEMPSGNAQYMRCPYHGWTFKNDGTLIGCPFPDGYGEDFVKDELSLIHADVDTYQGFVFARLTTDGPRLREWLGRAATDIFDRLVLSSPEGEAELTGGWIHHRVAANWKVVMENETDGYHPKFVHASVFSVAKSNLQEIYDERARSRVRDLGGGHTELDHAPQYRSTGKRLDWLGDSPSLSPYIEAMVAAHGEERAEQILVDGPPHALIFPNLFISEGFLLHIEPVAVEHTVQHSTPIYFKGADSLNDRIRIKMQGSIGPAGMLLADDTEMYNRNQVGLRAHEPEWLVLRRGLSRETLEADGVRSSNITDETSQRGMWAQYLRMMIADGATPSH